MSDGINDVVTVDTAKRAREVVTTLAELKHRLIYEGELSEESHALYNNIEQTLHQATGEIYGCLLYTSPSPRDGLLSRMPSSA